MSGLGAFFILGSGINIAVFSALLRWTPVLAEIRGTAFGKSIAPDADLTGLAGVTLIMGLLLAGLGSVWLARLGLRARRVAAKPDNRTARASGQVLKALFYAILSFAFFPVPLVLRILQTAETPALMARLGLEGLGVFSGLWSLLKLAPVISLVGIFLLAWLLAWLLLRWAHRAPQPALSTVP